jgi:preprotein translocase subunit SecG
MSILIGFLYVVQVIVCLLLALVVMLQKPKEGGLNSAIGGGALEASLGADAANVLIKTTAVLGAILLINTLVLARLTSTVHSKSLMAAEAEPAPQTEQVAPQLPMTPPAPAAKPAAPAPAAKAAPAPAAAAQTDSGELIAVIAAAIAAAEGTSPDGYVVRSIRRLDTNKWR